MNRGAVCAFSRREADALLEALSAHLRPVVSFGLATGCRMGEILNLEWHRVDFDRRGPGWTMAPPKRRGTWHPLNNDAIPAPRAVEGDHGRWCLRTRASAWSAWALVETCPQAGRDHGVRFHDLRHTWASWHVTNGTSLQELMELGGWKSYEMVLRYAHLAPDHLSHAPRRA